MTISTTSYAVFACHSAACAPPPAGRGGSSGGGHSKAAAAALEKALTHGHVGLSQREAASLVKAGLLVRASGKGKGLGNTPVWEPTALARRNANQTADTRKVLLGGREHPVVGESETHFRVMRPNGETMQIPKSIAKVVE